MFNETVYENLKMSLKARYSSAKKDLEKERNEDKRFRSVELIAQKQGELDGLALTLIAMFHEEKTKGLHQFETFEEWI